MALRTARIKFLLVFVGLYLGACRQATEMSSVDLLALVGEPDSLTEALDLEMRPTLGGNRFVRGWHPSKQGSKLRLLNTGSVSRLEITNLSRRSRYLRLEGQVLSGSADQQINVSAAGLDVVSIDASMPIEIALPTSLPLGRVPVDLEVPEGVTIAVDRAFLSEPLPKGEISIDDGVIRQSGYSIVDLGVPIRAGSTIGLRFDPPDPASSDQRYEVWIERDAKVPERHFEWRASILNRLRGQRQISIALPKGNQLVRLRLIAAGRGAAATWRDFTLDSPLASAVALKPTPPNAPAVVVVYVMDALRADALEHLSGVTTVTGVTGVSPTLDRLADEGVTYLNHIAVAPNTLPSTKALFIGRYFLRRGGWKLPLGGTATLAEIYRDAGYRTGLFSGNGYVSETYGTARGFDQIATEVVETGAPSQAGYSDNAETVHRAAIEWLDRIPPKEKVFVYLHTLHPHTPYDPPAALRRKFGADGNSRIDGSTETLLSIKRGRIQPERSDREHLKGLYAASVAYNDRQLAQFLAALYERYSPDQILFAATSDHGEELFDHDGVLHGYTLYDEAVRIPLIISWPGVAKPCRLDVPTDTLDLHAALRTLVDRSSATSATSPSTAGNDFWSQLRNCRNGASPRQPIRFAAAASIEGGIFMALSKTHKLIWAPRTGITWGSGEGRGRSRDVEYLFDLQTDPGESVNLAGGGTVTETWLRSQLLGWMESAAAIEGGENMPQIDAAERQRLLALGYLE